MILPVVVDRKVLCIERDAEGTQVVVRRMRPCAVRVIPRGVFLAADIPVFEDQLEYIPLDEDT